MYVVITFYHDQAYLQFESTGRDRRPFTTPHDTEEDDDMV